MLDSRALPAEEQVHNNERIRMLVLSRKRNESILIDGDIKVVVLGIRGDKVRLGITAPRSIPVVRKEITDVMAAKPRPEGNMQQ